MMPDMKHMIGISMVRAVVSRVDGTCVRHEPAGLFKLTLTLKTEDEEPLEREFLCVEGMLEEEMKERMKAIGAYWVD